MGGGERLEAHIDKSLQVCAAEPKHNNSRELAKLQPTCSGTLLSTADAVVSVVGMCGRFTHREGFSTSTGDCQLPINLLKNWDTSV